MTRPTFVLDLMVVQQLPGRPQPVPIDELDDRDQLFEAVFQRCPGQDDRIGRSMRLRARAAMVFQFLTRCASSTITRSGAHWR